MDPGYISGGPFDNFGQDKLYYPVQLQDELTKTWHYNLAIYNTMASVQWQKPSEAESLLFAIADSNAIGVDAIFERMGARYCEHFNLTGPSTGCEAAWRYYNQSLETECYLRLVNGSFITLTGAVVNSTAGGKKMLRPTTAAGAARNRCPDSLFSDEWKGYRTGGRFRKAGFSGQVARINNDGEYNIIYELAANTFDPVTGRCAYDQDPQMLVDYKTSGIATLPNGRPDWYTFVSRWRARFAKLFYGPLLNDADSPELKGAQFTEYQVQGTSTWFGVWNETRGINTPVMNGGKLRYYSTGDFYPWIQGRKIVKTGPYKNISVSMEFGTTYWDASHGSWHGIDWLQQILPAQIEAGDVVWSPFIAAGWSEQEELNTRPAQWLGFLKCLIVTGAEYFYAGFFSLHNPFPDSRNWIWQAAAPTYAQSLTSNWLDAFYNGELLHGDMPIPPTSCDILKYTTTEPMHWVTINGLKRSENRSDGCELPSAPYEPYRFWAGSQNVAVYVRLLHSARKYVIASTIQPQSNLEYEAPLEMNITITLNGT
jgi:hypothetical protein